MCILLLSLFCSNVVNVWHTFWWHGHNAGYETIQPSLADFAFHTTNLQSLLCKILNMWKFILGLWGESPYLVYFLYNWVLNIWKFVIRTHNSITEVSLWVTLLSHVALWQLSEPDLMAAAFSVVNTGGWNKSECSCTMWWTLCSWRHSWYTWYRKKHFCTKLDYSIPFWILWAWYGIAVFGVIESDAFGTSWIFAKVSLCLLDLVTNQSDQ